MKWCNQCQHFTHTAKWQGICQKGIIEGEMWSQTATHAQSCPEYSTRVATPVITLAPDDSDLYAGRQQIQDEASEGRWRGER